jgi:hypothetical protein
MKRFIALCSCTLASLALLAGCGDSITPSASVVADVQTLPGYETFFSPEQIAQVFSDATEVRDDGKTWPVSKDPVMTTFRMEDAPAAFKDRYQTFSVGGETRAYLNLGAPQDEAAQTRLLTNLEAVSTWKEILADNGKPLFADVYAIDKPGGSRVPDSVDGKAPADSREIHPLRMITKKGILTMTVDGEFSLTNSNGNILMDFNNTKDISIPIVGTLMKPGGFRMEFLAFPYKNGWLVYGGSPVQVEKFADQYDPAESTRMMTAMFRWLIQVSIVPL